MRNHYSNKNLYNRFCELTSCGRVVSEETQNPVIIDPTIITDRLITINAMFRLYNEKQKEFDKKLSTIIVKADYSNYIFESKKFYGISLSARNRYSQFSGVPENNLTEQDIANITKLMPKKTNGRFDFDIDRITLCNKLCKNVDSDYGFNNKKLVIGTSREGKPMNLVDMVATDYGMSNDDVIAMFEHIRGIVSSQVQYNKYELDEDLMSMFVMLQLYFINHNNTKQVNEIFDLAQQTYRTKSLNFLIATKSYMASKKPTLTASAKKPVVLMDVINTHEIQLINAYLDYLISTVYQGKKHLPAAISCEYVRQSYVGSVCFAAKRGIINATDLEKYRKQFDDLLIDKNNKLYNFTAYYYLIGRATGIMTKNDLCDFMNQNMDLFNSIVKEAVRGVEVISKANTPNYYRSFSSVYSKFIPSYSPITIITSMIPNTNGVGSEFDKVIKLVTKYINYAMPSDKAITVLFDTIMYAANLKNEEPLETDTSNEKQLFSKSDLLAKVSKDATSYTSNKIVQYVLS
jgi:hypothetical protein